MIRLHDCEIELSDDLKRDLEIVLERLKLDVREGLIVGMQAVCLRADGIPHQVNGGHMRPQMNEMHVQFVLENRRAALRYSPFLIPSKQNHDRV